MDYTLLVKFVAIIFVIWFAYTRFAGVKGLRQLTSNQFQDELKGNLNKVLIDVREPFEVKQGYIPGAQNIPLSQIKQRISEIPMDRTIYLYCRSGMRSKQAARILRKNGYPKLAHLQGGISSWNGKLSK